MTTLPLLPPEEHVLATLERDGSRRWLFPKLSKGKHWYRRRVVAYGLILFFVALPYFKFHNKPLVLLDLAHRQFTFFGLTLFPTDSLLLALAMLAFILGIFLTTAIFGRIWCGWACPQTVYMEYVYRPIERFFDGTMGKGRKPSSDLPIWRKFLKYIAFFLVSAFLTHTFLAYFVGIDALLLWVQRSPFEHPASFVLIAVTTLALFFNFGYFREQLCLVACPYGRFQSVLLDRNSLIVSYDHRRGEPRGKLKQESKKKKEGCTGCGDCGPCCENNKGDCIDCNQCVQTCPTGIDIRKGLQMECLHCTQCADACDEIMEKINKPKGLIRYSSQNMIEGTPTRTLRPRVIIYPALLLVVITTFLVLLYYRSPIDVTVMRNLGSPFMIQPDKSIQNNFKLKVQNRTDQPMEVTVEAVGSKEIPAEAILLSQSHASWTIKPLEFDTIPVLISIPPSVFKLGQAQIQLRFKADGKILKEVPCRMLGP